LRIGVYNYAKKKKGVKEKKEEIGQ